MKIDIKRIFWQMGQMLLPHHLYAQEESILGHTAQAMKHTGLPTYGIVKVSWDDALFYQGVISLSELTLILPEGHLIDIPGNSLPTSLDLNTTGKSELALYLHVLAERQEKEEEVSFSTESVKIKFAMNRLLLSPQKNVESSKFVFKLGDFEKSQEREWKLREAYIPPLLTTHPKPFLSNLFLNIQNVIKNVTKKLEREMEGAEFFASQSAGLIFCFVELSRLNRFCENCLNGHVTPHPYYLYEKMCHVIDCVRSNSDDIPLYNHENLSRLFSDLLHQIEYLLIKDQKNFSFVEFEREGSSYVIESLPPEISKAKEVYIIVQKPDVNTPLNSNSLKLTSQHRKEFVQQFFVSGINLTPIQKPSFLSSRFAEEIEAFLIEQKEEWKKTVSEGNLVLSHQDFTEKFQVFLYWRVHSGAV